MKQIFFLIFSLFIFISTALAQTSETFDVATFKPPSGWKKQPTANAVQYVTEDAKTGASCIIMLTKAIPGLGDSKVNFDAAWETMVKEMVTVSTAPEMQPAEDRDGWETLSGFAPFELNGSKGVVILVTASGDNKMVNVLIFTNTNVYEKNIADFLASVSLKKPSDSVSKKESVTPQKPISSPASKSGFTFTTSNFDDGWIATEKADWVEATKGNIKALLHFPNAVTAKYYSDSDEGIRAAWNNLIAPRYDNLQNYTAWFSTSDIPRPFVIAGELSDKQAGKRVYVVLFRKGDTGWIEIISPNKNTFLNNFGVDNTTLSNYVDPKLFARLEKLAVYNKFAIAASDLKGKWSDKFSASFFNYRTSDGQYTGMNTVASVINFNFTSTSSYNWDGYLTNNANSAGTAKTFKTTGTFKMVDDWQIHFSDIQGKPKTYNAYFSCFKGGRILWLQDKDYGGYSPFGKVE